MRQAVGTTCAIAARVGIDDLAAPEGWGDLGDLPDDEGLRFVELSRATAGRPLGRHHRRRRLRINGARTPALSRFYREQPPGALDRGSNASHKVPVVGVGRFTDPGRHGRES